MCHLHCRMRTHRHSRNATCKLRFRLSNWRSHGGYRSANPSDGKSIYQLRSYFVVWLTIQSSHALDYKRILLSQWIFTGLFIISWFFLPETACESANECSELSTECQGSIAERGTRSVPSVNSRSSTESPSMPSENVSQPCE